MKVIIIKKTKLTMNIRDKLFRFTLTKIEFSNISLGSITNCLAGLSNHPIARPQIIPLICAM